MDKYQLCFLGSLLIASESLSVDPRLWLRSLSAAPETPEAPGIMFVDDEVEWKDASERCEAVGGWLWAPNADELANTEANAPDHWTGWGRQATIMDKKYFTDARGNDLPQDFKAWGPNQPDGDEDAICVESHDLKLYDEECDNKRKFFCEFSRFAYKKHGKREWVESEKTWNDAKKICEDKKGWLWAPKNEKWLKVATSDEFWTGWNDRDLEGTFMDMKNNTLRSDDSVWDDREPNYHNEKDCVKSKDMRLNDEDCDKKLSFYCEIPVTKIATSKGTPTTTTTAISTTTRPNNATPTTTVPKKDEHSGGNQGGGKVEAEVTEATATQVRITILTAAGVLVFASAL